MKPIPNSLMMKIMDYLKEGFSSGQTVDKTSSFRHMTIAMLQKQAELDVALPQLGRPSILNDTKKKNSAACDTTQGKKIPRQAPQNS